MPRYAFTFKKDDVFVEFITSDKNLVEKQFSVWVNAAAQYTKSHSQQALLKSKVEPEHSVDDEKAQAKQEKKAEKVPVKEKSEKTTRSKKDSTIEDKKPNPETTISLKSAQLDETSTTTEKIEAKSEVEIQPIEPEAPQKNQIEESEKVEQIEENKEVFDQASSLLKTINAIQEPQAPQDEAKVQPQMPDFESVLENTIDTQSFEPVRTKDNVFLEIINTKSPQDKFQYFLITAHYLHENENLERFTLKQINAKLMQNLAMVVDHTVLRDAINAGFAELVPDLTGISNVNEYKITDKGEKFYQKNM